MDVDGDEVRTVWESVRPLVKETGRRPVAVEGTADGADVAEIGLNRWGFGRRSAADVIEAAGAMSGRDAVRGLERAGTAEYFEREWDRIVARHRSLTAARVGPAPTAAQLAGARPDQFELERRLMEWEEQRLPTVAGQPAPELEYVLTGPCAMLFLPTTQPEHVAAYLHYFGADQRGSLLLALLRDWHERYGAEVYACYGTMMQLAVSRPPSTLSDALQLAAEQQSISSSLELSLRAHARLLLGRPDWYLHDRP